MNSAPPRPHPSEAAILRAAEEYLRNAEYADLTTLQLQLAVSRALTAKDAGEDDRQAAVRAVDARRAFERAEAWRSEAAGRFIAACWAAPLAKTPGGEKVTVYWSGRPYARVWVLASTDWQTGERKRTVHHEFFTPLKDRLNGTR